MKSKDKETKSENFKSTFIRNFVGGIATGLGLTVGISLVAYLLSLLVSAFGGIPYIGATFSNVINNILESLKR